MRPARALLACLVALAVTAAAHAQPKPTDNPYPCSPDEPMAKAFSLAKSAEYLDTVAQFWMKPNSCGACHANFGYLMARPLVGDRPSPLVAETRQFLAARKPNNHGFSFDSESVAAAFALAWDDRRAGDKLRPATRQALGRIWPLQRQNGTWCPLGCGEVLPAENDRHYTAVLSALAAGVAPEGYARTAEARDGLIRVRRYLAKSPARNLHDQAMLLWAAQHVDGLMTTAERDAAVRSLLGRQNRDGGWSFAALSDAPGKPSDGYGTAFTVYVLRQAGLPASRPELVRGAAWLRSNQRASGGWFTPSPAAGPTEGGVGTRDLYVQNLGTAFAVLALYACEEGGRSVRHLPAPGGAPGLALRDRLIAD